MGRKPGREFRAKVVEERYGGYDDLVEHVGSGDRLRVEPTERRSSAQLAESSSEGLERMMRVADWLPDLSQLGVEHRLLAAWLVLISLLVLLLGGMHVCRIFLKCLKVFVHEIKHELAGLWSAI